MKKYALLLAVWMSAAQAQQLDLSSLDGLASRAREAQNVDLDAEKLKLASGLLGDTEGGQAKNLVSAMQGVFVRAFEFDRTGQYSRSDVDAVRAQLKGPSWSRIVDMKDKDESVELWFHINNGKMGGMALIASEPKELTVVNIVGPLDMQALGKLMGGMGVSVNVPGLSGGNPKPEPRSAPRAEPKPAPKNDE